MFVANAWPQRQSDRPVDHQVERPADQKGKRIWQHQRYHCADPSALDVLLTEDDDQGKVRHHRRDDVRGRITDAISRLRHFG